MVSFSKPVGSLSTAENIPAKRKQILNSKLTDENNVDKEAIKWRKQEATQQGQKKQPLKHLASRPPKNLNSLIEAANSSDDSDIPMPPICHITGSKTANSEAESAHDIDEQTIHLEDPRLDEKGNDKDEDNTIEVVEKPMEMAEQELSE